MPRAALCLEGHWVKMRPGAAVMAHPRRWMAVGCHRPRAQRGTSCCAVTGASSAVLREANVSPPGIFPRNPHITPINLPYLQVHGSRIIARLTKIKGMFWCQMVAHLVYTRVMRAAAIYNDVLAFVVDFQDTIHANETHIERMVHIMQQEVRHTFSGAVPFSIYTLC